MRVCGTHINSVYSLFFLQYAITIYLRHKLKYYHLNEHIMAAKCEDSARTSYIYKSTNRKERRAA